MELNTIYNENNLETMARMPNDFIDCIITSPPYNKNGFRGRKDTSKGKGRWQNSNISYGDYNDDMNELDYQEWQIKIINEMHRVLKPTGSIFYSHKERRANNIVLHPLEWILKTEAKYWQEIIWDRLMSIDHNVGYLAPVNELIFWLAKDKPSVYKKGGETNIWRIPPKPERDHPAPFPIPLVEKCINLVTKQGDLIYDPFMGSGTTALGCVKHKRNFIGSEISKEYCDIANKRINNELDQYKLFK